MKDILEEVLYQHVEIHSQSGFQDDGVLEEYDERWVKLRKSNGQTIYFPIANIRLLKLL